MNHIYHGADLAIILGSGVKYTGQHHVQASIPYTDLPGCVPTGVAGHKGILNIINAHHKKILLCQGRYHLYEGRTVEQVQSIVRFLDAEAGVRRILLTNAAGGICDSLSIGDLMLITSVQNMQIPISAGRGLLANTQAAPMQVQSPLTQQLSAYEPRIHAGRYAALLGPNYETHAEIAMLKALGCDAVGMSTYLELQYCLQNGLDVAAISVITNSWSDKDTIPTHDEVLINSLRGQDRLQVIFDWLLG